MGFIVGKDFKGQIELEYMNISAAEVSTLWNSNHKYSIIECNFWLTYEDRHAGKDPIIREKYSIKNQDFVDHYEDENNSGGYSHWKDIHYHALAKYVDEFENATPLY